MVSVAAVLATDHDGTVTDVRIALGGAAPRPWRARRAEARLLGGPLTREAVQAAMDDELTDAQALPQNAFKVPLLRSLVAAALVALDPAEDPR